MRPTVIIITSTDGTDVARIDVPALTTWQRLRWALWCALPAWMRRWS